MLVYFHQDVIYVDFKEIYVVYFFIYLFFIFSVFSIDKFLQ